MNLSARQMRVIHSYNEVEIMPNSLIIFDIDDTVIKFPDLGKAWWNAKEAANLEKLGSPAKARQATLDEWIHLISVYDPIHINEPVFKNFIEAATAANCHIIFLTARDSSLASLTEFHLDTCRIQVDSRDIYYSLNKAEAINKIIEEPRFTNCKSIIVIDDMLHNLVNIREHVEGPPLHLYKFGAD